MQNGCAYSQRLSLRKKANNAAITQCILKVQLSSLKYTANGIVLRALWVLTMLQSSAAYVRTAAIAKLYAAVLETHCPVMHYVHHTTTTIDAISATAITNITACATAVSLLLL
jgi:hypothetical protein